jgi:hypothetical protein
VGAGSERSSHAAYRPILIPSFDIGPGEQHAGMNLTPDGQAILDAGCQVAPATTTTTIGGG